MYTSIHIHACIPAIYIYIYIECTNYIVLNQVPSPFVWATKGPCSQFQILGVKTSPRKKSSANVYGSYTSIHTYTRLIHYFYIMYTNDIVLNQILQIQSPFVWAASRGRRRHRCATDISGLGALASPERWRAFFFLFVVVVVCITTCV